jgi:predicted phage baseplate assembly protein
MPLPAPDLDDRTFQDILDEARRRIPQHCPKWTDHNLSDPGITLLELFAWMTDLMLYRLNRVPDKMYIKFLDLIGLRLEPAHTASVDLTFRLTAPQPVDITIPMGTQVATDRVATEPAVSFTTDRDIPIRVPRLAHVLAMHATLFHDYDPALRTDDQGLTVFSNVPQLDDALYFGFENSLSAHKLALTLQCRNAEGAGINPSDPPIAWETWDEAEHRWAPARLDEDTTGGLNRDGVVILDTSARAGFSVVDGRHAFWLRCRVTRTGDRAYSKSPRMSGVSVGSLGGSGLATHSFTVDAEELGTTDGTPAQLLELQTIPVLPRRPGETLEVEDEVGTFQPWLEVLDFGASGPDDPHFVLDSATGAVEFGPRIRTAEGQERQYGRVSPSGRRVRFSSYRSGGGIAGNVGANRLTLLKSSIPYVAEVTNHTPASGGTNAEDLEHAKWRAPNLLRSNERAVTPEDFEILACTASNGIARARCLAVRGDAVATPDARLAVPGVVRLQLVPTLSAHMAGPVTAESLELPERVRSEVRAYLDERRLLTCELELEPADYSWVSILAQLRARPNANRERIQAQATSTLYRYVHPTLGGPDGQGWPFGRELMAGELYPLLQQIEGVEIVENITLQAVDSATRKVGGAELRLSPGAYGLLCSHEHRVTVV